MHAKIISKTNCILIPMIVTSSTDGQSQPFSKQSPTVRRPQRYAKLFPFLQSRVNIPMSKQHCNSSSYRYYIPSDANQTRKQTTMHVGCKLCKQAALLYHSLEFIHAHPSTHTHTQSHGLRQRHQTDRIQIAFYHVASINRLQMITHCT